MSRSDCDLPMDRSMARATVRLVIGGLAMVALLPPLLWVAFGFWDEARHPELSGSLRPLAISALEMGAASSLLALGLWGLVFNRRVRAMQAAERRLRATTKRDPLTGLLNREGLRITLARALQRRSKPRSDVGVMLIDIDRFHLVNNSLGQPAGDALLRSVADRIRAVVRERDVVARVGGDQFAIQVEGVSGAQALVVMARNVLRAFEPSYAVGGRDMVATLSIGIAMAGEASQNTDSLLKNAEIAMRAAKAGGGGAYRSFEDHMRVDDDVRLELDRRLRCALKNGEFALVFQPIMQASSERIVAVEALLRWADPAHEALVSPAEFITVLEQTGLIVAVGNWVLHEACRQGLPWLAGGSHSLVLSVNVSPRQFAEPNFVDTVASILRETGFPPSRLQLEVTEGLLLEPTPECLDKINALVNTGVRLAVDDFGMGYSSLAYLKSLPLHTLKIDRMFVRDAVERQCDATIVRAIVDLGHGLGLHVTAEGVETEAQRTLLERLGVDSMQGYLFARPIGAEAMRVMLAERGTASADEEPPTNWSSTMAALLHPA